MAGITRIHITDTMTGRGAHRFTDSRRLQPAANALYRDIFKGLGIELAPGYEEKRVTKDEFAAGRIPWMERRNQNDGARASFRYVPFTQLPAEVVIAGHR